MARLNKTRFALLGILSMGSASGYDIKKMMEQSTNHFWREGDGSIYPILKQLLDEGMVSCEMINSESEKPKKVYTISSDGQRELEDWLEEDPVMFPNRNELLLKVFFGWNVDSKVTIKHVEKFRRHVAEKLDNYKEFASKFFQNELSKSQQYRFLTLKAGMTFTEATLKWCDDALKVLKNE